MIDVRPIRESEAETFLHLLCDVFSLEFDRAHSVFFNEPLYELDRKWALFEDGEMVSSLTTVPLEFGWGRAIGIAGVATDADRRCRGYGSQLLSHVVAHAADNGETAAYLFAKETGFYERLGFTVVDEVVRAEIATAPEKRMPPVLLFDEIKSIYDGWASESDCRLRRTNRRWSYWKWNLRLCNPCQAGYICVEGGLVRECIVTNPSPAWPLAMETDWFGLTSMAKLMSVPISKPCRELYLMGLGSPAVPQIFMTDQF